MNRFQWEEPQTMEEACSILANHGGNARILAGGTDVLIRWRQGSWQPSYLVNIKAIPGLDGVSYSEEEGLRLGSLVKVRTAELSPIIQEHYPALSAAATTFAGVQIRNLATLGGNVCNGSPAGDMIPSLIAFGAECRIVGPVGERWLPLEEIFVGPGRTSLQPGDVLAEFHLPPRGPNSGSLYIKHSPRSAMDIAAVGIAASVSLNPAEGLCSEVRIAMGAVAATPIRALDAERVLIGRRVDESLIDEAAKAAQVASRPITDIRSTGEHRRAIIEVLTRRALRHSLDMARGAGLSFERQRDLAVQATY